MALLIDGYNLLHVTGLVGRVGSGLQGSREALLRFLAAAIEPKELRDTTVVFDAAEAPPGLPRTVTHEGMTIRYASDYDEADALIEELIAANNVPRSLTVVSSDHRLQRAARRRRAPFVDSDVWFADAVRRRDQSRRTTAAAPRRDVQLSANEIDYWLAEFSEESATETRPGKRGAKAQEDDLNNPFPPGYGDDLLDESR
jgi:predicted RNA-binding protein with PIN domain